MAELDLNNIEEVNVEQQGIPMPPVEEVVRQAMLNIVKHDTPQGQVVLLQFATPVKLYTFQLNEDAANWLSNEIKPTKIKPATLLDMPKGVVSS